MRSALLLALFASTPSEAAPKPVCVDGWCWEHPAPLGGSLDVVVALSDKHALALSRDNRLYHWKKKKWVFLHEFDGYVHGLDATALDDIWAWGGNGYLAHFDGETWSEEPLETELTLVGRVEFEGRNVVIGADLTFQLREGRGLLAEGPVGGPYEVQIFDDRLEAIAAADDAVLVAGGIDVLLRRQAGSETWEGLPEGRFGRTQPAEDLPREGSSELPRIQHMWTDGSGRIWAGVTHGYDDKQVLIRRGPRGWLPLGHDLPKSDGLGRFGEVDGQVFMTPGGFSPKVPMYRSEGWRLVVDDTWLVDESPNRPKDLDGADGAMFAVGAGGLLARHDGEQWRRLAGAAQGFTIGQLSPDGNTALTTTGLLERKRKGWRSLGEPAPQEVMPLAVGSDTDAWASGPEALYHWDGATWAKTDMLGPVFAMHQQGKDAWRVGVDGTWHWDGSTWTDLGLQERAVVVWGRAANDVWTGTTGELHHWDGRAWTPIPIPSRQRLRAINGLAWDDVWFLTDDALLHWDGNQIAPVPLWNTPGDHRDGLAVAPTADGGLWVAGDNGLVRHRQPDGTWVDHSIEGVRSLWGVHVRDGVVTVTGENAMLSRSVR